MVEQDEQDGAGLGGVLDGRENPAAGPRHPAAHVSPLPPYIARLPTTEGDCCHVSIPCTTAGGAAAQTCPIPDEHCCGGLMLLQVRARPGQGDQHAGRGPAALQHALLSTLLPLLRLQRPRRRRQRRCVMSRVSTHLLPAESLTTLCSYCCCGPPLFRQGCGVQLRRRGLVRARAVLCERLGAGLHHPAPRQHRACPHYETQPSFKLVLPPQSKQQTLSAP